MLHNGMYAISPFVVFSLLCKKTKGLKTFHFLGSFLSMDNFQRHGALPTGATLVGATLSGTSWLQKKHSRTQTRVQEAQVRLDYQTLDGADLVRQDGLTSRTLALKMSSELPLGFGEDEFWKNNFPVRPYLPTYYGRVMVATFDHDTSWTSKDIGSMKGNYFYLCDKVLETVEHKWKLEMLQPCTVENLRAGSAWNPYSVSLLLGELAVPGTHTACLCYWVFISFVPKTDTAEPFLLPEPQASQTLPTEEDIKEMHWTQKTLKSGLLKKCAAVLLDFKQNNETESDHQDYSWLALVAVEDATKYRVKILNVGSKVVHLADALLLQKSVRRNALLCFPIDKNGPKMSKSFALRHAG